MFDFRKARKGLVCSTGVGWGAGEEGFGGQGKRGFGDRGGGACAGGERGLVRVGCCAGVVRWAVCCVSRRFAFGEGGGVRDCCNVDADCVLLHRGWGWLGWGAGLRHVFCF